MISKAQTEQKDLTIGNESLAEPSQGSHDSSGEQEMLEEHNTGPESQQPESNPGVETPDDEFDLESIRMSQAYGKQISVKKLLTTVPVRKPNKTQFFRTHPKYRMDVHLLKYGETDELYVVKPGVLAAVFELAKPYRLVLTVDRIGTAFIWPLAIPDEERPLDWHKSAMEADFEAQKGWVRMASNQALGAYEISKALGELPEPEWPSESWNKLVGVGFRQKIIDTPEHIIIQKLQGLM